MARFDNAPPRGIPDLTITLPTPPQTNATVRIRGGIYFSGPERWLMESTNTTVNDLKLIKWFTLRFELIGKDSQEGGTDTVRYSGIIATVPPFTNPPFVADQSGNVTVMQRSLRPVYDFSTQVPINVLNEDPVPGAKDEIYARLSLYNTLTGEVIKIDSNVVEVQL